MDTLRGALECVDLHTGELLRPEHVQALIEGVALRIESLGVGECAKLAKYLRNRAPGLALAQKSVLPRLKALAEPWSAQAVSLACICWYLVRALHKRPARARYRALYRHLLAAYGALQDRARRGERIAARGRRGGAAPAPSRLECHRGVQCGITPLSLRPQGRHSGLSRPVPCLVQSAHPALGTAQGDQRSRVPDRTAGPRLAHAARLSALADTALIHGRCRALASLDTPDPEHCVPRDRPARVCKDELPHFDRCLKTCCKSVSYRAQKILVTTSQCTTRFSAAILRGFGQRSPSHRRSGAPCWAV